MGCRGRNAQIRAALVSGGLGSAGVGGAAVVAAPGWRQAEEGAPECHSLCKAQERPGHHTGEQGLWGHGGLSLGTEKELRD